MRLCAAWRLPALHGAEDYSNGVKMGGYGREKPVYWLYEGTRLKATTSILHLPPKTGLRSTPSTTPPLPPVARTMARQACGRITTRNYYGAFVSIPTATISRRCVTRPRTTLPANLRQRPIRHMLWPMLANSLYSQGRRR